MGNFVDSIFLGRPGSNRSSVADVNSIPPLEAMVPIGPYSDTNITEQNYDLPPPPDMLNDANSQSTASIDVSFYIFAQNADFLNIFRHRTLAI